MRRARRPLNTMPTSDQKPLRVLHVTSGVDPRQGGPTTALLALIAAQVEAGLSVSVASTFGSDFKPDTANAMWQSGANVRLIGPSTHLFAYHRDIKPVLNEMIRAADLVHVHGAWEEIQHQACRIARALAKPYLLTPHGMLDPWSLSQGALKKKLYLALRLRRDLNAAAAIHFTDEAERALVAPLRLTAPTVVQRLIVDLSDFQPPPPRGTFRSRFAAQLGDREIVLFMSRIHPKKGLDILVPAMAQVNAMLVIAGPDVDGYRATVERTAREHGIADRLLFPGMLYGRDRAAALVDSSLFVLPSYQENFGIVVIEALAAGTPVVISDQVNIHRQISDARVGEVLPARVEPLAGALARWMGDAALRSAASERALRFIAQEYDRTRLAAQWTELYQRITQSKA
jgi:glycosyltransferase involved in cell wall biosynthesis